MFIDILFYLALGSFIFFLGMGAHKFLQWLIADPDSQPTQEELSDLKEKLTLARSLAEITYQKLLPSEGRKILLELLAGMSRSLPEARRTLNLVKIQEDSTREERLYAYTQAQYWADREGKSEKFEADFSEDFPSDWLH